ncbi:MAG: elongation factor G [Euzebyales bacterium]|nr:elongation factor G [Euzebyales bacterium]
MPGIDPTPTARIRNVVLLGHGGTGKTTLAEALLRTGGQGDGRGGNFDTEPEERDRGHSLSLGVASLPWQGHKLNLLDAPGTPEAIGDAYPALAAADLAVFVIDATVGVQSQHDQLWAACETAGLPRVVFLNKLDKEGAAYQSNVDALRERYGKPLAPVHMPIGVEREFTGVIDLLHFNAVELVDGQRVTTEVRDERREQAGRNREFLVEAIVEHDDAMLERYLEGETPEAKELAVCFAEGVASCSFFPLLCGSATMDMGVQLLADFLVEEAPAPASSDGPTAATVFKTLSDPYVGRINALRLRSGTLRADDHLTVARTGADVRMHQLFALSGREQTPVAEVAAGDIAAVAKLDDVVTGDALVANGAAVETPRVAPPEPYHRTAVKAASAGDEDKLSIALSRLAEEDPSLRVEHDPETAQLVLRTYGPGHADVAIARLARKFGVSVEQVAVRLPYRETLRGPGEGLGRHVKQSGGHGQYGVCSIEVEPLPRGEGFVFEDRIVGGVIPRQFIPSVEKGVRQAMASGVLAGYPVVDVLVRLVEGKHHPVDSSQVAFEVAGSLAFRDAAARAGTVLLEPMCEVTVTVPDALTGDVMGDLSSRRGRISGTEAAPAPGRTLVRAIVPEAELRSYTAELRSLTSGAGSAEIAPATHDEAPEHVTRKVVAAAAEE